MTIWKYIIKLTHDCVTQAEVFHLDINLCVEVSHSETGVNKRDDQGQSDCEEQSDHRGQNVNKVVSDNSEHQDNTIRILRTHLNGTFRAQLIYKIT